MINCRLPFRRRTTRLTICCTALFNTTFITRDRSLCLRRLDDQWYHCSRREYPMLPISRRDIFHGLTSAAVCRVGGALASPLLLSRAEAQVTPDIVKFRP